MQHTAVSTSRHDGDPPATGDRLGCLQGAIASAIHYLPTQGPISIFVHHNTLHSFEDLPFDQAVLKGRERYGCEPYLSEDRYRSELACGRISMDDLRQVLMDDLGEQADDLIASFGTRYTLRLAMLQMTLHSAPDAELKWLLAETDLLRRFRGEVSATRREQMLHQTRNWVLHRDAKFDRAESWSESQWETRVLELLWQACHDGVEAANLPPPTQPPPTRMRDLLLEATGEDIYSMVDEVLIRFCGSFLDQGFANWSLPHRDEGFARAFAKLYLHRLAIRPAWMDGMRGELQSILQTGFDPLRSIAESLEALGLDLAADSGAVEEKICSTLLSLKGWAGMIWQLETSAPWSPKPAPLGSLNEYLAIRLMLERYAIVNLGRRYLPAKERRRTDGGASGHIGGAGKTDGGASGHIGLMRRIRAFAEQRVPGNRGPSIEQRTYTIFQLAQAGGWAPEQLAAMTQPQWSCLVQEIEAFDSLERRRILHAAYERHYLVAALDAVAIHSRQRREKQLTGNAPAYIAVFCIDDREESFRRHLEEVDPACETASAAGFYAVAMYYQGADHAHYRPLCPAIVTPKHYVREEPLFSVVEASRRRAQRRRQIGQVTHQIHAGSRTMLGGWLTGVLGALATVPMVARIMAPGLTAKIRRSFRSFVSPPATELHIEREAAEPGSSLEALGYSLDEMAAIVVRILQDIGTVQNFPPILLFFGHGSGSLNNPHESAYNCGACSGGRGGPNARAWALMANDPRVRSRAAQLGVSIPDDVRFVGAFHNTCSDAVEYFDLDLLPRSHRNLFRRIEASVDEARARDAHERSRRFESAPLNLTPREALEHVEGRSEDLSQARPEYNHATNAVTFVGRRQWSRGLFADRRIFLTSYNPEVDDESVPVLSRILGAAIPVCAGIALEYYFSTVDTEGYGCGSKLPHNVASMLGVMTGAASDLRPGLSQQMIEIHEPMRPLFVVETTPERMNRVLEGSAGIARLVRGNWVHLVLFDPQTSTLLRYVAGDYRLYVPETTRLPQVESSIDWYRGQRGHLGFATVSDA